MMAPISSVSFPALFLALSFWVLLVSPAHSLNCTSEKFNKQYANCSALQSLNAYLHYTYDSSNSSLSIAFVAAPAKSEGWVGWGINPSSTKMVGGQALVAFKTNGVLGVKTYNLVSYQGIQEAKLSFDVWDKRAETDSNSGNFVIFASLKVPDKAEKLNQIWQVGSSVTNEKPDKHSLGPANRQAIGTLELVASSPSGSGGGGNDSSTNTPPTGSNSTSSADYRIKGFRLSFYFGLFVFLGDLIGI
uniref:DOMON domain-containing protein n=1 Tax=Rhizophora mucronata TaxID=61149 RepID=A0A2P2IIP8_RHIMU